MVTLLRADARPYVICAHVSVSPYSFPRMWTQSGQTGTHIRILVSYSEAQNPIFPAFGQAPDATGTHGCFLGLSLCTGFLAACLSLCEISGRSGHVWAFGMAGLLYGVCGEKEYDIPNHLDMHIFGV